MCACAYVMCVHMLDGSLCVHVCACMCEMALCMRDGNTVQRSGWIIHFVCVCLEYECKCIRVCGVCISSCASVHVYVQGLHGVCMVYTH